MEQKQRIGLVCFLLGILGGGFGVYSIVYKDDNLSVIDKSAAVGVVRPWMAVLLASVVMAIPGIALWLLPGNKTLNKE